MKLTRADLDQMTPGERALLVHHVALMEIRTIGKAYAGWIARETLHHSAATTARRDGLDGRVARGQVGCCRHLAVLRSLTLEVERLGRPDLAEGHARLLLGEMESGKIRGRLHAMRRLARPGG